MSKILTISIAAYNVADYIREGLDSLVASKYIDDLEVFVVDDGGQDETLDIAKEYQSQYPNSIIPVHKENGGYGTTVNYSIAHATGKYFKLMDGDDWFDTDALDQLIEQLKDGDTDVIITPYKKGPDKESLTTRSFEGFFEDGVQQISQLKKLTGIAMWSICYKTSVLKATNLDLPSHTLYTDQYYSLYPFAKAETIQHLNYPVYSYRIGRDGQSVSRESRIKNIKMIETICKDLVQFLAKQKNHTNYNYLFYRTLVTYRNTYKTFLLLPFSNENARRLKEFDYFIGTTHPELYKEFPNNKGNYRLGYLVKFLRYFDYKVYFILKLIYPKGFPNF